MNFNQAVSIIKDLGEDIYSNELLGGIIVSADFYAELLDTCFILKEIKDLNFFRTVDAKKFLFSEFHPFLLEALNALEDLRPDYISAMKPYRKKIESVVLFKKSLKQFQSLRLIEIAQENAVDVEAPVPFKYIRFMSKEGISGAKIKLINGQHLYRSKLTIYSVYNLNNLMWMGPEAYAREYVANLQKVLDKEESEDE